MVSVLEMQNVCKTYYGEGGVKIHANDHVNFTLKKGEIHALLGENGAGKSTLVMNLCREPDSGAVLIQGEQIELRTPKDAIEQGIGIAYQDLSRSLVERHTVAENILSLSTSFLLSIKTVEEAVKNALTKFGLGDLDPKMKVWKLSGGEKQRVEILKALIIDPRIIILDEPTSMLTPPEVENLFALMKSLKGEGRSIVIITHHLEEAIRISDRITVLRNGQVVSALDEKEVKRLKGSPEDGRRELARLMVGKDTLYDLARKPMKSGDAIINVKNLHVDNDMGDLVVKGVSFEVRENQILGLAGIAGNGQRELLEALVHWREAKSGDVVLHGEDITNKPVSKIRELGVSYIPENRKKAMVLDLSVRENLMISYYSETDGPFIERSRMVELTDELIERYAIDTPSPLAPMRSLSGGNKQKVVVARELSRRPPQGSNLFLIAENPTSGLDIATTQFVREELLKVRESGAAVLLVSSDLTEILTLSDEIAVIYKGEIIGKVRTDDTTREAIGLMMGGVLPQSAEKGARTQ
ncbi:MAG: ABC transporter ATP-binding protein [Candidatus Thorarchaeota archaeon]|jgi:simple sugar transport system ATP-binding protein